MFNIYPNFLAIHNYIMIGGLDLLIFEAAYDKPR